MTLAWTLANLVLLGLPAALCVMGLREAVRIGVAGALGFRLFGVQWGVGPILLRGRWGTVQHRFAALPLGGDVRVASSRPRQHRLSRWAITLAPLLFQGLVVIVGVANGVFSMGALDDGFAPAAMLQWANLVLFAVHLLVPSETKSGFSSDLRLVSLLAVAGPDDDRASRASELIMRTESYLAAGRIDLAQRELGRAIVQLGREPSLVQLEDRLTRIGLAPEPASAARLDAMPNPFEHPSCSWGRTSGPLPLLRRGGMLAIRIVPLAGALFFLCVHQYAALLESAHARWVDQARTVALGRDAQACRAHLEVLQSRISGLTIVSKIPRELQIAELRARATLYACAGDLDRAVRDQSLAVQIADSLRRHRASESPADSTERVESELSHSSELRQLAAWHAARGAYREALRTTQRAEAELAVADHRATASPPSPQRDWALGTLARERQELQQTRRRIIDGMGVRS